MKINKSMGTTSTERLLAQLCENTFLRLWSYPNPFKSPGKEICDLLAVFDNHVFIFFDRHSDILKDESKSFDVRWKRWKREVIDKQKQAALGAERFIRKHPDQVFLDAKCNQRLPVEIPSTDLHVHKIIVANGAAEACKAESSENVTGSLAVNYSETADALEHPFLIVLDRANPIHLFDEQNIGIVFNELDTVVDFTSYLSEKEAAISKYDMLGYCGEEDLLAHYLTNFDSQERRHFIGVKESNINACIIGEGEWCDFEMSQAYKVRQQSNAVAYYWDQIVQSTSQNALDGNLQGDPGSIFERDSAIKQMAAEPRFMRRELSKTIAKSLKKFPESLPAPARYINVMPSYHSGVAYIFLQLRPVDFIDTVEVADKHRDIRGHILNVACGVLKNKKPDLERVVGIAIYAPTFSTINSEDFVYLDCSSWTQENISEYERLNEGLGLLESNAVIETIKTAFEFPKVRSNLRRNIGRNDPCPCGSNKKFKWCHGRSKNRRRER